MKWLTPSVHFTVKRIRSAIRTYYEYFGHCPTTLEISDDLLLPAMTWFENQGTRIDVEDERPSTFYGLRIERAPGIDVLKVKD